MTAWICFSVAPSCITTTIISWLLRCSTVFLHHVIFERPGFVNNALKQAPHCRIIQRAGIRLDHVAKDFRLPLRRPGRKMMQLLVMSDLQRALRAFIKQLQNLLVNLVNALSPLGHILHANRLPVPDFNQRTKRSMPCSCSAAYRSSMARTRALPTTAASASDCAWRI